MRLAVQNEQGESKTRGIILKSKFALPVTLAYQQSMDYDNRYYNSCY